MAKRRFLVDLDLNQNELQYPKIHNLASAPAGPTSGQVYFNTTSDRLFYWDGSVWVDVTSGTVNLEAVAPLTLTFSGTTYSYGIQASTGATFGYMSAADKAKLDAATPLEVVDTLVIRDASGGISVGSMTASGGIVTPTVTGLTGPTSPSDATSKDYVDTLVAGLSSTDIVVDAPLTVTQSGITFSIGINAATGATFGYMSAADKAKLDAATSSTVGDTLVIRDSNGDINVNMVSGLTGPTLDSDAANKGYVDAVAQGLDPKEACRVIATSSITLSGTQSIDGVPLAVNDRVLVAGQGGSTTTPDLANGIYVAGTGSWLRSEDADGTPASEVSAGMFTFVTEGSVYADTGWVLATNDPITVDTTPLQFVQFSQAGVIEAGDGMSQTGNVFNVGAGNGISVDSTSVTVTAGTGVSVDGSGVNVDGSSLAGTGVTWNATTGEFEVVAGGVTDITAGSGLTAAGTTGSVTLDVGAGNGITVNTDTIEVTAGTGISVNPNGVNVVAGTGVTVDSNGVNIDGSGLAGNGLNYDSALGQIDINVGAGLTVSAATVSALTDGTTIQTNLNGELEVIPDTYPTKYTEASVVVGSTIGPVTVTHNLNTLYVNVTVFDDTTGEEVVLDVEHDTANSVIIDANGGTFGVNVNVIG